MNSDVYVLSYNNYYNRTVKKFDTLAAYLVTPYYNNIKITGCAFNPNDNITTTQVITEANFIGDYVIVTPTASSTISSRWFIIEAKRLLIGQWELTLKRDVIVDNYSAVITSPVFVEKATLQVGDPLLYNKENMGFNQIKTSETLLKDNSLSQWLVGYISKDASASDVAIDAIASTADLYGGASLISWPMYKYVLGNASIQPITDNLYPVMQFTYYETDSLIGKWASMWINVEHGNMSSYGNLATSSMNSGIVIKSGKYILDGPTQDYIIWKAATNTAVTNAIKGNTALLTAYKNNANVNANASDVAYIKSINGKTIKFDDGKIYKISINSYPGWTYSSSDRLATTDPIYSQVISSLTTSACFDIVGVSDPVYMKMEASGTKYEIIMTEQPQVNGTAEIKTDRIKSDNTMYDIFCIPYNDIVLAESSVLRTNISSNISQNIASSLATALGAKLYDLQLLPYCPVPELMSTEAGVIDLTLTDKTQYYSKCLDSLSRTIGIIFYAHSTNLSIDIPCVINPLGKVGGIVEKTGYASFYGEGSTTIRAKGYYTITFNLGRLPFINITDFSEVDPPTIVRSPNLDVDEYYFYNKVADDESSDVLADVTFYNNIIYGEDHTLTASITVTMEVIYNEYENPSYTAVELKTSNECDVYRLCSPNYNGIFEFSPAKNNSVENFNVDISFKPYAPYIHVNPNFKGLYGSDFNDTRGLICGGDFSYGVISDAFTQYSINNKNYAQIFDRGMRNIDFNNAISKQEAAWAIAAGSVSGAASGAIGGGIMGGPYGAAAGAVIGGATGIAGGAIDYQNLEKRMNETRTYTVDMYNYNLGNIKALPDSIAKANAFNANYKGWPFVEYYTCTDSEKEAFLSKLKYDGMTVMKIGTINQYLLTDDTYIKSFLIRAEGIVDDSHMIDEIKNELSKGCYWRI